jgi:hypothetical protein
MRMASAVNTQDSYYAFLPVRFLVAPSYDQLRRLSGPLFFAGLTSLAVPETSFSFFEPAAPQAGGSRVVFASNRDGRVQLYVMNADTPLPAARTRLTVIATPTTRGIT